MSALDAAHALATYISQKTGHETEVVAEHDRVTADLRVIKGGWAITIGGKVVERVSYEGVPMGGWSLEALRDLAARAA